MSIDKKYITSDEIEKVEHLLLDLQNKDPITIKNELIKLINKIGERCYSDAKKSCSLMDLRSNY